MTSNQLLSELQKLDLEEQKRLMASWIESLANQETDISQILSEQQIEELDKRIQYMEENPKAGIPWKEAKQKILSRLNNA